MTNYKEHGIKERPVGYMLFRQYVRAIVDGIYYRKVTVDGLENVPSPGNPVVLVSNHQNCLNDPLEYALLFNDRIPRFLARANVFQIHPIADKFLRYLRMLPVYRAGFDGTASLSNNSKTFDAASDALVRGQTVVLYPECGHQDKRWLGNFSVGYLKLAFLAAEKMGFRKDILIQPSCNHYSGYFHVREDMVVRFGEPVSLMQYYDLYKESPRAAMRKVNAVVKDRVERLMLNITDLEHYEEIDFLRENSFGLAFASDHGFDSDNLLEKLESDQKLVSALQTSSDSEEIFFRTREYMKFLKDKGLRDWLFEKDPGVAYLSANTLLLLVTLPLFLIFMVPNILLYLVPRLFMKRLIKDQMFRGSFNMGISIFITIPLCYIIPAIIIALNACIWNAVLYIILGPLTFLMTWFYIVKFLKLRGAFRYVMAKRDAMYGRMVSIRESLMKSVRGLL